MRNKIVAFLLCAVLVFSLFGCVLTPSDFEPSDSSQQTAQIYEGFNPVDTDAFDFAHKDYEQAELTAGYASLTEESERKCYEEIDKSIYHIDESVDGTGVTYKTLPISMEGVYLSEAQIRLVISAYFLDKPQVFWVGSSFEYSNSAGKTVIQLHSYMNAEAVSAAAEHMSAQVTALYESLDADLSLYDRELALHDMLAENCVYLENTENIDSNFRPFTSLGALVDSQAVCEGYTRGMQLLLQGVGIESYYVLGRGSEELHMWNCVKLDDQWYYVDVTWDDEDSGTVTYDYFNITTEQLAFDHSINPTYSELTDEEICGTESNVAFSFNIDVPLCTDESMSYYAHNAVLVDSLYYGSLQRITEAITDAAENGEDRIYLYIEEAYLGYDFALEHLFYGGDYVFFDCIDEANTMLLYTEVDRDNISIRKSPQHSVVTVYLEYIND